MSLSAVAVLAIIVAISIGESIVRRIIGGGKPARFPEDRRK
jgi:hypothetical protein